MAGKGTERKHTYEIKWKHFSSKCWIENGNGEKVFYKEGGVFLDAQGRVLYEFHHKSSVFRETYYINKMYGDLAATIKKKGLLSLSISDWKIEIPDEPKMETYRPIFGL